MSMVGCGILTASQPTVLNAIEKKKNIMPNNRSRGRRGELEAAIIMGGERISRTGEEGSDITDKWGRTWEVKLIKKWTNRILGWFSQAHRQGDVGVLVRADRGEWYVMIKAKEYIEDRDEELR